MGMKTLQQIKDEYARSIWYKDWRDLMTVNPTYLNKHIDAICILSQQQALKNASDNAKSWQSINLGTHGVDKQSILNENNLVK